MSDAAVLAAPTGASPAATPPPAGGAHDDAFASLDRMAGAEPAAPKSEPAKAAPKQEAPKTEKPVAPKDKPEAPPETKGDDKPDNTPPEKMAPKALREAYSKTKQQLKAVQDELAAAKNVAPKEFKVTEAPEFKSLKEKLDSVQKHAAELEETVKFTNYEASTEYKEKYQVPYEKTAQSSTATAQQLKISKTDDAGNVTSRNLTAQEFWKIVQQPDDDSALASAEKLFGENSARAARVVELRDKVVAAHNAAAQAKEDFKKNIGERTKQMQEQQEGFTRAQTESFNKHRDEAIAKYPQWFKADEGDAKGAEVLERGMAWADKAFSELPPEQAPKVHAALRNKAGAFDHVVHKLNNTQSQLKTALEKLAAYEKSKPGSGVTAPADAEGEQDTMEAMLSKLDKVAQER